MSFCVYYVAPVIIQYYLAPVFSFAVVFSPFFVAIAFVLGTRAVILSRKVKRSFVDYLYFFPVHVHVVSWASNWFKNWGQVMDPGLKTGK